MEEEAAAESGKTVGGCLLKSGGSILGDDEESHNEPTERKKTGSLSRRVKKPAELQHGGVSDEVLDEATGKRRTQVRRGSNASGSEQFRASETGTPEAAAFGLWLAEGAGELQRLMPPLQTESDAHESSSLPDRLRLCAEEFERLQQQNKALHAELRGLQKNGRFASEIHTQGITCSNIDVDVTAAGVKATPSIDRVSVKELPSTGDRISMQDINRGQSGSGSRSGTPQTRVSGLMVEPELRANTRTIIKTAGTECSGDRSQFSLCIQRLWAWFAVKEAAWYETKYFSWAKYIKAQKIYIGISFSALAFALLGPPFWVLADIPNDPGDNILDTFLVIAMITFSIDIVLSVAVNPRLYPRSIFFYMDIIGTLSILFDLKFMCLASDSAGDSATLMRSARAAKAAARAGRLSAVSRALSLYYAQDALAFKKKNKEIQAGAMSARLQNKLATRVSLMAIVLVIGVPLLALGQYPEVDLSMQVWAQRLEERYCEAYDIIELNGSATESPHPFQEAVQELRRFYEDAGYPLPYQLEHFDEKVVLPDRSHATIRGSSVLPDEEPRRAENIFRQRVQRCLVQRRGCGGSVKDASILFDFGAANRQEALMEVCIVVFLVVVMAAVSASLSSVLNRLLVRAMERMLNEVNRTASYVLAEFTAALDATESEKEMSDMTEMDILERVIQKLSRLAQLGKQANKISFADCESLDMEAKGILMHAQVEFESGPEVTSMSSCSSATSSKPQFRPHAMSEGEDFPELPEVVTHLPFPSDNIYSWNLNLLMLDFNGMDKVVLHIFFDSEIGYNAGRTWADLNVFKRFHKVVRAGYKDVPYHNYAHAVDCVHGVFRIMCHVDASQWISGADQYALLLAALGHDLGHFGKTNAFLVETKHNLALRYNDKSPLENMHCSTLFGICAQEETNVFARMDKAAFTQARKICINAILHTDLAMHFDMVKDISKAFEMSSEVCTRQARAGKVMLTEYFDKVLKGDYMLWQRLFVHLADISNPVKPWKVYLLWTDRVVEEFFAQGDEEKRLGIPVGMLNDRDKVNQACSEHGFINFLVAPLMISAFKVFQPFYPMADQLASNLSRWRDEWVKQKEPSEEDLRKRDADVEKVCSQIEDTRMMSIENERYALTGTKSTIAPSTPHGHHMTTTPTSRERE